MFVAVADELEDTGDAIYFWAGFTGELRAFLDDLEISERVNDRLFGWIGFELLADGSVRVSGVGGKRLMSTARIYQMICATGLSRN